MSDIDILRRAHKYESEHGPGCWEALNVGATRQDINRLKSAELIELKHHSSQIGMSEYGPATYRLSEKGNKLVIDQNRVSPPISAETILAAMGLIVGFDDIKQKIARAIEGRKRIHFLLIGPPACAKTLFLEAVRNTVPDAYMAFGSRTSGRGLSDALFEKQPSVLLMDEVDKMRHDVMSLMLGLLQSGEIIETKSGDTRGIKLGTMVIGACNTTKKMPPEFLSRFAFRPEFPNYTREEFIDVCRGMLAHVAGCPGELSEMIGSMVYDNRLGDVRQAKGVWDLMDEPTQEEALKVLSLIQKYRPGGHRQNKQNLL
ncbi:MAG: AAA family ATPase [Dehalococcoidia bacterium]